MVNVLKELIVSEALAEINYFIEKMTPEVSLTVLTAFKLFVCSFTKLTACDHKEMNPSKVSFLVRIKHFVSHFHSL